jgi:DNA-3-methyladenine glycosylase
VLIRAIEPRTGITRATDGPGKLTRALSITLKYNGCDITRGPITVSAPESAAAFEIGVSPRIGITKAADLPLRFFIKGNRFVSGAKPGPRR